MLRAHSIPGPVAALRFQDHAAEGARRTEAAGARRVADAHLTYSNDAPETIPLFEAIEVTGAPRLPGAAVEVIGSPRAPGVLRGDAGPPSPDAVVEEAWREGRAIMSGLEARYGFRGVDGNGKPLRIETRWGSGTGNGTSLVPNASADNDTVFMGAIAGHDGMVHLGSHRQYLAHETMHTILVNRTPRLPDDTSISAVDESWADVVPALLFDQDWRIYDDLPTAQSLAYDVDIAPTTPSGRPLRTIADVRSERGLQIHTPGKVVSLAAVRTAERLGRDVTADIWFAALTTHLDQQLAAATSEPRSQDAYGLWAVEPAARATLAAAAPLGTAAVDAVIAGWRSIGVEAKQSEHSRTTLATTDTRPRTIGQ